MIISQAIGFIFDISVYLKSMLMILWQMKN